MNRWSQRRGVASASRRGYLGGGWLVLAIVVAVVLSAIVSTVARALRRETAHSDPDPPADADDSHARLAALATVHVPAESVVHPVERNLRVLLTTEATYPFHWGGLATWCHALITELDDITFSMLAMCDQPSPRLRFELPPNLVDFRAVPLWGIRNAWEIDSSRTSRPLRRPPTSAVLEREFVPAYRTLVRQVLGAPRDDTALAEALHALYSFGTRYDFDRAFRMPQAWEAFVEEARRHVPARAAELGLPNVRVSTIELAASAGWLYHWLFPLSLEIPDVDIAHATMAGICSMVGVVAKLEHGAGFLLSEHGIYLRESYLAEHSTQDSPFGKIVKLGFARRMTELAYAYADAIAPCCDYNHRWERRIGVEPERIHTAYYGIDPVSWAPAERRPNPAPVVVWSGRIDPLKDVETLLRAAAVVLRARPDVRFRLYGAAPPGNEEYHARCLALHEALELTGQVTFEGFSAKPAEALAEADLVVLSSISEGFPFATLEAMLSGKAVVATGVGGLAEQVTPECGRIVPPRDPDALGEAVLEVLADPVLLDALSRGARARASALFGVSQFRATHRAIYRRVVSVSQETETACRSAGIAGEPRASTNRSTAGPWRMARLEGVPADDRPAASGEKPRGGRTA